MPFFMSPCPPWVPGFWSHLAPLLCSTSPHPTPVSYHSSFCSLLSSVLPSLLLTICNCSTISPSKPVLGPWFTSLDTLSLRELAHFCSLSYQVTWEFPKLYFHPDLFATYHTPRSKFSSPKTECHFSLPLLPPNLYLPRSANGWTHSHSGFPDAPRHW